MPRMRRSARPIKHEGKTKNKGKQKRKQVEVMYSSDSDSPIDLNQSEYWVCPPSSRKHLIPDATMISSRRASLRSAKRLIETPSVSRCSQRQKSREHSAANDVSQQLDDLVGNIIILEYQTPAGSLESPSRYLREVANPSTLTPAMRHEETEKVGNSVAPERFTADIPEMEEVREAEKSMSNHITQMEGQNTYHEAASASLNVNDLEEAECIPLEQEPLAEYIEASNTIEERANKCYSKSTSMVGRPCLSFSLNLTEMVKMWDDEDHEVNSVGGSLSMDTVDGYQVKPESMPILRKILSKHGEIAKNCTVVRRKYRSQFLEMTCDIITEMQDKDLSKIKEDDLQDMIALVNELKIMKLEIGWLHQRLVEILEARQILKQSGMLKEKKESNRQIIENVERELEEYEAEKMAVAAKFQSVCHKESVSKEKLARARDESTMINATIADAKSKVRRFLNCSLADGLL